MERRRVFIVGDSLFAETLAQMLGKTETVEVIGAAATPETALPLLRLRRPDALILACEGKLRTNAIGQFLLADPGLPLILADLSTDGVQIITSLRIGAHPPDLFAAIAALPRRSAT
jgi:DNA-binding NarL/FixJ family response regulator